MPEAASSIIEWLIAIKGSARMEVRGDDEICSASKSGKINRSLSLIVIIESFQVSPPYLLGWTSLSSS